MSDLKTMIKEHLNEEGKLDCKDAYKISAKLKMPIEEVGKMAKNMDIRISGCELGQFGVLKGTGEYSLEAENRLKPFLDSQNRVTCKEARGQAGGIGLKAIRGTLKEKNIDVTYCGLGCFTVKKTFSFVSKNKNMDRKCRWRTSFWKRKN